MRSLCKARAFLVGLMLCLAALGAAGCGDDGGGESAASNGSERLQRVRFVVNPGFSGHLAVWVAEDEGFFEAHGLDVEIVSNPTGSTNLLIAGEADALMIAPSLPIFAANEGHSMAIAATLQSRIDQMLIAREDFEVDAEPGEFPEVVESLRGATIGLNAPGGAVEFNFKFLLERAGLNPDTDVNIVYTGGLPQLIAAFEGGRFDATFTPQPASAELLESGAGKALLSLAEGEGPDALQQPFTALTVTRDFYNENPETVQALVDAMVDTESFIKAEENEQAVEDIAADRVLEGLDPQILSDIVADVRTTLNVGPFTRNELDRVERVLLQVGVLTESVPAEDLLVRGITVDASP